MKIRKKKKEKEKEKRKKKKRKIGLIIQNFYIIILLEI